uniref:Nuclear receptor domain-containing protein n=1 Tax=Steinernema glaseri TaxID=37863 RepID=A0A1I8AV22_9BILA
MDQSRIHGFYPPQMDRSSVVCSSVTSSFLDSAVTTPAESVVSAASNFDFDANAFTSFQQHLSSFPLHLYNASHGMGLTSPGAPSATDPHAPSSADSMLYNNMAATPTGQHNSMFQGVPNIGARPYDAFLDTYAMAATAMRPSVFAHSRDTVAQPHSHERQNGIDSLSSTPYSPYASLRSPTTSSLPPSLTPSIAATPQIGRNRCQVCISADSNGLHFGAKTCAACAAFFRRTISDKKKYSCKRTSRCVIHVTDTTGYRKICRNCRMKRCLEVGMLPENVQNKRQRIPPPPPRSTSNSEQVVQTTIQTLQSQVQNVQTAQRPIPPLDTNPNMMFGSLAL